jgi:beta-glucanase (GH16 family)
MQRKNIPGKFIIFGVSICLSFLLSCKKENDPIPGLTIQDVSQVRTASESTMEFILSINAPSTKTVSVDYSLEDGTATSPGDFVAASGTVSFPANQTQASIDVSIKGDPLNTRQPNLRFTVKLSNPKYCTITTPSANGIIVTENGTYLSTDNTGYSTPETYPGYTLAWSDEFSRTSLNQDSWNYELGNGSGGWGNNELEYYTNSYKNVFVSDSNLIIEARKETTGNYNYTSARLTTQGKKVFKFGRIDIRAKLPKGQGIWPALWMLGSNINTVGWPACGEIDIMELIGSIPSTVTGTMHWKGSSGSHAQEGDNYVLKEGDFSEQFHVFSIEWTQDNIKWFIDDQLFVTTSVSNTGVDYYPFNADQFFIFNVAVGGNWPGSPDYTTVFPQRMFVDYVRVFQ